VSKKSLPKAIQQTTLDPGVTSADRGERQGPELPPVVGTSGSETSHGDGAVGLGPTPIDLPAAERPVRIGAQRDAGGRRSLARSIIERHAAYAAFGGVIPVPIANVAGVTAVIVRMVKVLSGLYGVPFERDRARAIVIGLMGGTVPTGIGAVTASTLVALIPGSAIIGLGASSIAAVACTRSIGRVFVEHFENGATLSDLPAGQSTQRQYRAPGAR
jgi:uncharacterized protein (DUF697 family)